MVIFYQMKLIINMYKYIVLIVQDVYYQQDHNYKVCLKIKRMKN